MKNAPDIGIVGTQYGNPVERHLINEAEKSLSDVIYVMIVIEMFCVNISYNGDRRREFEKGSIALISLCDKKFALAQFCVTSEPIKLSTDYYSWIKSCRSHYACYNGSGCGLTVCHCT